MSDASFLASVAVTLPQARGVAEVTIQEDIGKQQRQILKILPDDRLLAAGDPSLVQLMRVPHDVLVVFQQQFGRRFRQVEQLGSQRVMEAVDVVLVQALQRLVSQVLGQFFESPDVEQRQHPLVQHQFVCKRNLRAVVGSAARCGGRRSGSGGVLVRPRGMVSVLAISGYGGRGFGGLVGKQRDVVVEAESPVAGLAGDFPQDPLFYQTLDQLVGGRISCSREHLDFIDTNDRLAKQLFQNVDPVPCRAPKVLQNPVAALLAQSQNAAGRLGGLTTDIGNAP